MPRPRLSSGQVRCGNCGYTWFPDATKWRNHSLSHNHKVLHCPTCNSNVRLDGEMLKEILKRSLFVKRLRDVGKA
jgi:Zn finger protein HypA/HybF involved in hydrogenase expression